MLAIKHHEKQNDKIEQIIGKWQTLDEFLLFILVKLRGTMQPDTYKPIVSISVMPIEEHDSFQFAGQNSASNNHGSFFLITCLTILCSYNFIISSA